MVTRKKNGPPPLEAAEEAEFLRLLKQWQLPVKTRKLNGLGNRDWPDRLILGPFRFTLLIEFKRKELGKVSPGQADLFKELSNFGHPVQLFDDGKQAALFVEEQLTNYMAQQKADEEAH